MSDFGSHLAQARRERKLGLEPPDDNPAWHRYAERRAVKAFRQTALAAYGSIAVFTAIGWALQTWIL